MSEKDIDQVTGIETTGHSWDGIKELNNPLPRWWVILFYICIAWSVVYWIFMPSWPLVTSYLKGTRNHSERQNVEEVMKQVQTDRSAQMQQLLNVDSIAAIENDPQLLEYTLKAGEAIFGDNCATCHGAGGQGAVGGYPALIDDDWIWGGSLDDIQQTIHYGIRSENDQTRFNLMQAYGDSGVLNGGQIADMVQYVLNLSGREADQQAVERAAPVFAQQCVACHGEDGKGNHALGAPNLTDAIWLYGGDAASIDATLTHGRGGVMPAWTDRLSDEQIKAVAVYVHSLGGGE